MVESCVFDLNPIQEVISCSQLTATPALWIAFFSASILFAILGIFVKSKGKYYVLWAVFSLIFLGITAFFVSSPNIIQNIWGLFS